MRIILILPWQVCNVREYFLLSVPNLCLFGLTQSAFLAKKLFHFHVCVDGRCVLEGMGLLLLANHDHIRDRVKKTDELVLLHLNLAQL